MSIFPICKMVTCMEVKTKIYLNWISRPAVTGKVKGNETGRNALPQSKSIITKSVTKFAPEIAKLFSHSNNNIKTIKIGLGSVLLCYALDIPFEHVSIWIAPHVSHTTREGVVQNDKSTGMILMMTYFCVYIYIYIRGRRTIVASNSSGEVFLFIVSADSSR